MLKKCITKGFTQVEPGKGLQKLWCYSLKTGLYRYFSYTYNKSSKQVYKIVKPKELRKLYPAYHTLGVDQAIERILEAKGINPQENELERQYAI